MFMTTCHCSENASACTPVVSACRHFRNFLESYQRMSLSTARRTMGLSRSDGDHFTPFCLFRLAMPAIERPWWPVADFGRALQPERHSSVAMLPVSVRRIALGAPTGCAIILSITSTLSIPTSSEKHCWTAGPWARWSRLFF
jgi:hypothetical protein